MFKIQREIYIIHVTSGRESNPFAILIVFIEFPN